MKDCAYCGRANDVSTVACDGCGSTEFKQQSTEGKEVGFVAREDSSSAPPWGFRELMSNPVALYRQLIIISYVVYITWFLLPLAETHLLGDDTLYLLGAHGYGAILPIPVKVGWMFFFLNLALAPGLWYFSAAARWIYVANICFFVIMTPLAGASVMSPLSSFFGYINALADGALIMLSFTSPIRERFQRIREELLGPA